jgi:hypothetical protein
VAERNEQRIAMDRKRTKPSARSKAGLFSMVQAHVRFALHRQFLVVCAACERVRDDVGRWHELSLYPFDAVPGQFSHGLCPECLKRLYPEYCEEEGDE